MPTLAPVDREAPVSVIMTVLNEQAHLDAAVASVLGNGFEPGVNVVIAVGPSTDATAQMADTIAAQHPNVRVVANPTGATPAGLNLALALCGDDVVVRIDGHTVLPHGYIALAVDALAQSGAGNVGGRMVPGADAPLGHAIAVAMSSRFGLGSAGHRVGGGEGATESVFLGSFRRSALDAVGGYDEHFRRAQDWELNFRLREAGYEVYYVPSMQVPYHPRSTWRSLARQFFHSGAWRREVVRTHPQTASARYLAPPVVVAAIGVGTALGVIGLASQVWWLALGFVAPLAYLAGVLVGALALWSRAGWRSVALMPGVLMTMHVAWGLGFIRGVR
ncbi:glycosyltransferase family 2 protein [Demequina aurantiaca]|uniref:glycosyltransferase family 2 protein n=1 Tax=Demequina aurantiaca TaxID=676200 RepID=UPI003D3488CF